MAGRSIPVISLAGLDTPARAAAAASSIGEACREHGFFYISDHGVQSELQERLEALSQRFFALPEAAKMRLAMEHGGPAWRGYFGIGGELTSGRPDLKEGVYFGAELGPEHPLVKANTPLHGANLFPELPGFKDTVLAYLQSMTALGHRLMELISLSLGLDAGYFRQHYTGDPLILFRIFHYPPEAPDAPERWGVGEHTDYGILTILKQDQQGGLQVKSRGAWLEAPPVPGTFICNIGDMLDRMTRGLYRSTPHRVRNSSGRSRYSWPFFFDPNFQAEVRPLALPVTVRDDQDERWDQASVHAFAGTYGDYLLRKVGRVFPELKAKVQK